MIANISPGVVIGFHVDPAGVVIKNSATTYVRRCVKTNDGVETLALACSCLKQSDSVHVRTKQIFDGVVFDQKILCRLGPSHHIGICLHEINMTVAGV